ncbi:LysR family transcriptional regulator [Shewanella psychrotolerans]|uniref:LysR family transcriptional regulator n=1 Tax=Shewanella psychrotolerans TaxID=2864206 RepID=UPI001C65E0D0|nr:LysR family transcriptional regulator [Shewanella psychrotolerans]QYK02573.1 LysR family transcriptional regulator [Shewanella psychrotolerans]
MHSGIMDFVAVVEAGSFTAAAEQLKSSKASVSQRISDLESHLGVQLLFRSTRKLRLTEAGEHYYQSCKRGIEQFELGALAAQQLQHHLKGKITINSVGGIFAENWLAPAVLEFQQQYPNIEINLDLSSQREDLLVSPFDIVIRMGELPDSSLQARVLTHLDSHIVASPDYLSAHKPINHPEQLKAHQCLVGSVVNWQFVKNNRRLTVPVSGAFRCANGHILRQAALRGLGLIRSHDMYLRADIAQGRLTPVLADWQVQGQPLWMVFPPARFRSERVKAMADWLIDYAKRHVI